jgi:phosphoribosylaminoimidazole-succinocarboxamide synthase
LPLAPPILHTHIAGRSPDRQGKVRDIYDFGDRLLLVASDRISAFDFVLGSGIPDKGKVLSQISAFWFARTSHIVANHVISTDVADFPPEAASHADVLAGRSMLVRRTEPLPIECVARGYLSGSGWKDYRTNGTVCGVTLPAGLRESDRLPEPIFTPATKAETGHDINISEEDAATIVGRPLVDRVKALTLEIFRRGCAHAESKGIIIADTKFEFGLVGDGNPETDVVLIDEVLTPDSSRFWPADTYREGTSPPSYDKQFVRDYLETLDWNKKAPAPKLPAEIVAKTSAKYLEAYDRLTSQG